ncbi:MAG: hypothetical protein ACLTAY_11275 [Thomasclavelia ramosa]
MEGYRVKDCCAAGVGSDCCSCMIKSLIYGTMQENISELYKKNTDYCESLS